MHFRILKSGIVSEVSGSFSNISSIKIINESRIVREKEIFSSELGGIIKTREHIKVIKVQGKNRLTR